METVTLTIDGLTVSGRQGMTILELAQEMGIHIPTLCHDPALRPAGACRVCIVEDENTGRLLASCVTPIGAGMRISTSSPAVLATRRIIIELMMSNHPESCILCDKGNRCQLRRLAADLGVGIIDYDRITSYCQPLDLNPFISRDISKCILCGKCIRADHELVVVGALDYLQRGFASRPATWMDGALEASECTFCGTCVAVCPTGALSESWVTHPGSTTIAIPTVCPYCGCGCPLWAHPCDGELVSVEPRRTEQSPQPTICVRGHYGTDHIHHPDRLTAPLLRGEDGFRPIEWDEALDLLTERLTEIAERFGPKALGFFGSVHCTNEENFLFQKLARWALGSPNVDNGTRLGAVAGLMGLHETLGVAGCTNPISDLANSEVILVVGAHPLSSHPVASYMIKQAIARHGARLIYTNPQEDQLSTMAWLWLPLPVGMESLFLWSLMAVLVREGLCSGIRRGVSLGGWEEFKRQAREMDTSLLERYCGIIEDQLVRAASGLASTSRCSLVFGPGIWGASDPVSSVRAVAYLAVMLGCLGVSGGGVYPMDLAVNSLGACHMGTVPDRLPGLRDTTDLEALNELQSVWGGSVAQGPGLSLPRMLEAAGKGTLRALYVMGENPARTLPKQALKAIQSVEFLVVQDMFMSETASMAHLVLPGCGFAEKEGTFTSMDRRVQRTRAAVSPRGKSRPDWWILSEVLHRIKGTPPYDAPSDIMQEISSCLPEYRGIQYGDLDGMTPFCPCPQRGSPGEAILLRAGPPSVNLRWECPDVGKSRPSSERYSIRAFLADTLFHFSSATRSSRSQRLLWASSEPLVQMNKGEAEQMGLAEGQEVIVRTPKGAAKARLSLSDAMPRGSAWLYPGARWDELTVILPWRVDPSSHVPMLRQTWIGIEPKGGP